MSEPFVREFARASCNGGYISWSDGAASIEDRRAKFLDITGERLRAEPYGDFLVNFLCKEN